MTGHEKIISGVGIFGIMRVAKLQGIKPVVEQCVIVSAQRENGNRSGHYFGNPLHDFTNAPNLDNTQFE